MLFNILAGFIYIQRGGQKRRNCAASRCDDHMSFGLSNSTKTNRDYSTVFHCQTMPHSAQILTRRLPPSKATKNGQGLLVDLTAESPHPQPRMALADALAICDPLAASSVRKRPKLPRPD